MAKFRLSKLFGGDASSEADDPDQLQKILDRLATERADAIEKIKLAVPARCQALIDENEAELQRLEAESDKFHRVIEKADLLTEELTPRLAQASEKQFQKMKAEAISRHKAVLEMAFGKLKTALQGAALEQDHMLAVHQAAHDELVKFGAQNTLPVRLAFNGIPTVQNVGIFLDAALKELHPVAVEPNESLRVVEFIKQHRSYCPAEIASFPPQEAAALVDRGLATWADPRPRPSAPELADEGAVQPVRLRRSTWWRGATYGEGEIAAFPRDFARQLVSSGAAETITPGPVLGPSGGCDTGCKRARGLRAVASGRANWPATAWRAWRVTMAMVCTTQAATFWNGIHLFRHGSRRPIAELARDEKYRCMWRFRTLLDGDWSDIVNLSRAKDAARCAAVAKVNQEYDCSRGRAGPRRIAQTASLVPEAAPA